MYVFEKKHPEKLFKVLVNIDDPERETGFTFLDDLLPGDIYTAYHGGLRKRVGVVLSPVEIDSYGVKYVKARVFAMMDFDPK